MKRFVVQGNAFECGYKVGQKYAAEIRWRLQHNRITPATIQRHKLQLQSIFQRCTPMHLPIIQQIKGLAQGSKQDFWKLILLNSSELSEYHHGCSSIAFVDGKKAELFHNEDGTQGEKKDGCALVAYKLPTCTFHSYVYLGELPGNAYAWNNHGFFYSVNYLKIKKFQLAYVPSFFTTSLLAEAKSIEEALRILKKNPCSSGFHYFMGQGKRIISVEQVHERLSVQEVRGMYIHTNYLLHGILDALGEEYRSSQERHERIRHLLQQGLEPLPVLFDKKNRPYPVYCRTNDVGRTLSTVVFDGGKGKVTIYPRDSLKNKNCFSLLN